MFECYLTKVLHDSSASVGFIIVASTVSCNGLRMSRVVFCRFKGLRVPGVCLPIMCAGILSLLKAAWMVTG
jgi:hypothetical protein